MWNGCEGKSRMNERACVSSASQVVLERSSPTVPPGTDARLAQLLGRCFAHDPQQRPTATELRAELSALLTSLQVERPVAGPSQGGELLNREYIRWVGW
jgi:hypothetical protein